MTISDEYVDAKLYLIVANLRHTHQNFLISSSRVVLISDLEHIKKNIDDLLMRFSK